MDEKQKKTRKKTLLHGSTPETHLEASLSKGSPERKGGEKEGRKEEQKNRRTGQCALACCPVLLT